MQQRVDEGDGVVMIEAISTYFASPFTGPEIVLLGAILLMIIGRTA
jgi:hypothetical protein